MSESLPIPMPVAAVVVDTGLAHLDRVFEYAVPTDLDTAAQPGVRVRVSFAGRDVDGYVVQRLAEPTHHGQLASLRRVVSPEPVLTPAIYRLARAVADHMGGVLGDVLRLAVPKRHARAEKSVPPRGAPVPVRPVEVPDGPWARYPAGPALLRRIADGESPAASWVALPGQAPDSDWPRALATAAASALQGGRGALIVVPDHRDVDRVDAELTHLLGPGAHVRLTADDGPGKRYAAWLSLLRGHVQVVVGTRAAVYAPVHNVGLVAWWDDGDDVLDEPRAPYAHVRDVLTLRARLEGAALISGGFARSVEQQRAIEAGLTRPVVPATSDLRRSGPRIEVVGETDDEREGPVAQAQLPGRAWREAKAALERGSVLIQVPRSGYLPGMSCQSCRTPARCATCCGPLALDSVTASPSCRWCGRTEPFRCPSCDATALRSSVQGAKRTAEDLGRAFPGIPLMTSNAGAVLAAVPAEPALVVCTPGAEPLADGGYAAVLLLDAWATVDRASLDAAPEALRRWLAAAALARPRDAGGVVVLCGAPRHTTLPAVEALVRWDPAWLAERELAERRDLHLPPAVTMALVTGPRRALTAFADSPDLPARADLLGPRAMSGSADQRLLVRVPTDDRPALATAVAHARAIRSARKDPEQIAARLDPRELGSL